MFNLGAAAGGFDSKRKNKNTPPRGCSRNRPPVTGLIRSSKTAAAESYVTKRHPLDCSTPPPTPSVTKSSLTG